MRVPKDRTYYGALITWQGGSGAGNLFGYRLPWRAYVGGRFVYADTLEGVKSLVRKYTGH